MRRILEGPVRAVDVEASTAAWRSEGARIRFPPAGAVGALVAGIRAAFDVELEVDFLVEGVWRWCSSSRPHQFGSFTESKALLTLLGCCLTHCKFTR